MHWLAIHLPLLPLEIFVRNAPEGLPLALHETHRGNRRISLCNAAATAAGVLPGMHPKAARAVSRDVQILARNRPQEQSALHGIAEWACAITPMVVTEPPRGLILEVRRSLRLFGGNAALHQHVREGLEGLGYRAALCQAPTPIGAWLAVRAGTEGCIEELEQLRAHLHRLPTAMLPLRPARRKLLDNMGVSTLGALLRLPRSGLRQRLGNGFIHYLERALGEAADPRTPFVPAPRFQRSLELPCEISGSEPLLFAARRLLDELVGYLRARQMGTRQLHWSWIHAAEQTTHLELGLRNPGRDPLLIERLLAEQLERTPLEAPVRSITLRVEQLEPLGARPVASSLFPEERPSDIRMQRDTLLDILRARLGNDAIHTLPRIHEHRPEHGTPIGDGGTPPPVEHRQRPLWLLPEPQPLHQHRGIPYHGGRLLLEAERERIESGWWDGNRIARDYFIAHASSGERMWIYRDLQPPGGWYLHGFFG